MVTDPKAVTLLNGGTHDRLAFKVLATMLAYPDRKIAEVARQFSVTRQDVYRALTVARTAGYAAEVATLPPARRRREAARRGALSPNGEVSQ